jgi:16S rRNA (cytosine1402-N4)-methyltransferase
VTSDFVHTPVLLSETITAIRPSPGGAYIDATLGGGGHAEKVLELSSPHGIVLGIDADPVALEATRRRLAAYGDRLITANAYFDQLTDVAQAAGLSSVDGVFFDLGVSSPQLDTAERGFSFQHDAPLDMRFGPLARHSAAEIVNTLSAGELQRIFREYGEERFARRVAQRVIAERERAPITTTRQLADIVTRAKPRSRGEQIHPATRVFQALRIAVNDELGRLSRALPQAVALLRAGGRLAVISFHSLEDRIVKNFVRDEARGCVCPPEIPVCICGRQPTLRSLTPRPITASAEEVAANPRARSARLRVAERLSDDTNDHSSSMTDDSSSDNDSWRTAKSGTSGSST